MQETRLGFEEQFEYLKKAVFLKQLYDGFRVTGVVLLLWLLISQLHLFGM